MNKQQFKLKYEYLGSEEKIIIADNMDEAQEIFKEQVRKLNITPIKWVIAQIIDMEEYNLDA